MTILPTDDRILVLPDGVREDVTSAGILVKVTPTVESKRQLGGTGVIVAVGPGKRGKNGQRVPLVVREGERILFGEFQHREHHEDGKRYLIMQEADICAVLDETAV
ncbi:co-chaperone GroES [Ralstonia pickettii]|uniref:co-chaperone GroES n=1 Tax=Ralstonia pickettii TaxID=329 RepID=UPI0015CDEE63|nr:co-chaperone GroES [Ralstonia pickettii]